MKRVQNHLHKVKKDGEQNERISIGFDFTANFK